MGLFDMCLLVLGILHDENGYFLLGIQRAVCLNSWNSTSVLSVNFPLLKCLKFTSTRIEQKEQNRNLLP